MIIARIHRGLGNQLFQYAVGRNLAIQYNTHLKLDTSYFKHAKDGREYLLSNFNITENIANPEEIQRFKLHKYRKLPILKPVYRWLTNSNYHYYKEKSLDYDPQIFNIGADVYLDGFWQSERYFSDIKNIIRNEYTLITPPSNEFISKCKEIEASGPKSIAIHVRRGDYLNSPASGRLQALSKWYYDRAIQWMEKHIHNPHFFIFTDDVSWTRHNLCISLDTSFISDMQSHLKDYEELTLMSHCSHAIIANSTFSWWGAWLISNPNKFVIAPQEWFANTSYSIEDRVPSGWITLPSSSCNSHNYL